jgi:MoaA/NifB/PqqE/SkfB family radical SAM enzyme
MIETFRIEPVGDLAYRIGAARKSPPLETAPVGRKLDLVGKLYQRGINAQVSKVAQGERLAAPIVVDLDPTTFCDLACPECISTKVLNKGQFGPERLVRLAQELVEAKVKGVILIGGGEPLMHRAIDQVIEVLHQAGVRIGLVSNGTLIHRHLAALADRVSWTRISMDAATQSTYDRFRPSGRPLSVFPKVIENMRLLARHKAGKLGYSFLLMQRFDEQGRLLETNYDEVLAAGRLAKDIGCDYFEIKAMFDEGHNVVDQRGEDIELVSDQLEQLEALKSSEFHVLASSTWNSLKNKQSALQLKEYHRCGIAELRTTITPSGVYTCAYHRGNPKAHLGDLAETTLQEMWRGADVGRIDPERDCRFHCARHESNLELKRFARTETSQELIDDYDPFI